MDKTCSNCNKVFNYASRLKNHLQSTIHCRKSPEEIDKFFSQFKKKADYKCNICDKEFTKKQNLQRHINISNCKIEYDKKEREKQIEILQKQIDDLKNQTSQKQQLPILKKTNEPNKSIQNIQIINNNNNHNENIINNNLIINNTIVQHIYPLGYEKLPKLSQQEMIRLLELGANGVIEIVKLVCEQDENKNFYKLNMNKNNISFLSNQYKIDICQETELKQTLLKQCVILTYQMLIACSPLLSSEKIYAINSNLQNMSSKMKEEIYENGLKNIIEYELRNNNKTTKDKITKYTKDIITNPEVKAQATINYNKLLQIKEDTNKNKIPTSTLYDINQKLGNPITAPEMDIEFNFIEFNSKRFEYTTYYNYWIKRIKDENKYIKSNPNTTIGDITYFENRKKEIIGKIEKMRELNDKMRDVDEENNLIITKTNFKVEIASDYIKENDRLQELLRI